MIYFITGNKNKFEEAKAILKQQKVNELFEAWFADVHKGADIKKYL